MSEIRNLTRNGKTFYPLTTSSAVINEATGEGMVIDDEPTAGSDNLVKSGGIANMIPNINTLKKVVGLPNTDGKWYTGSGSISVLIPANSGERYSIKSNNQNLYVCFIPTGTEQDLVGGHVIPYCTGTTTIRGFNVSGVTPDDCGYIVVCIMQEGTVAVFTELVVDEYDYLNTGFVEFGKKIEKITEEINEKADISVGKNLLDISKITTGQAINSGGDFWTGLPNDYATTDYIKVNGNNIIANFEVPAGCNNAVYDEAKNVIRTFTNPYSYQSGDYYVIFSMKTTYNNPMVEYGNVVTEYVPYTESNTAVEAGKYLFEGKRTVEVIGNYSNDLQFFKLQMVSGIERKYGIDSNNNEMALAYVMFGSQKLNLFGKYKISIIAYTDCTLINNWGASVITKGSGVVEITKEYDLNNQHLECVVGIPSGSYTFRISTIKLEALDETARGILYPYMKENNLNPYNIVLECWNKFDSTTEGFGVTRFANMLEATDYYKDLSNGLYELLKENKYKMVIRCMPGVYDECEKRWAGQTVSGETVGINPGYSTTYTSFDVDAPELTQLKWDGHYGFAEDYIMTGDDYMNRCIFNISGGNKATQVINGFYINAKNTRYCIHPESAGNGFYGNWVIKNCILHSGGRPNTSVDVRQNMPCIGIGISAGERGLIENCLFESEKIYDSDVNMQFVGGHNNGDGTTYPKLFEAGGEIKVKDCDCNNLNFSMQSLYDSAVTPFKLIFEGCGRINNIHTFPSGEGITNNFKISNICSEISSITEE